MKYQRKYAPLFFILFTVGKLYAQPAPIVPVPGAPATFSALVKQVRGSVVNIHSTSVVKQSPVAVFPFGEESPFYQLVQPPERRAQSLGTGFIISADGEIVTNNHVIAPEDLGGRVADEIIVQLEDKTLYHARVVARDPATDLALLHIAANNLPALRLGDSDAVDVGDWVVAIGQPYGLSSTVTAGIVSAKGRRGEELGARGHYWDFIQTDTAINPGNSGGPLLNMRAEVIGVNTAINAKAQGLAFAVPTNLAKRVLSDLRRYGKVQRGWLGLRLIDLRDLGPREVGAEQLSGAVVARMDRNGPAAKAGLHQGDLVVSFDGVPVESADKLRFLIANAGIGKAVTLRILRGQRQDEVRLTTVAQP